MWIFYKVEHFIISFAVTWYDLRLTGLSSFLLKSYYILLMQFLSLYLTWKLVYLSITSHFDINVQIKNYNWSVLCMIKFEHARKSKVDNEHLKWNKEKHLWGFQAQPTDLLNISHFYKVSLKRQRSKCE